MNKASSTEGAKAKSAGIAAAAAVAGHDAHTVVGADGKPAVSAGASKEAQELFATRCQPCHGDSGLGDGPAAAALNPKPRSYRDKTWQSSVADAKIVKAIVEGGPAVGLSPLMPANPDLAAKKEVVQALVQIIRSFAEQSLVR